MNDNDKSFLCKYYGMFEIRVANMKPITCYIMENLLSKDFISIKRIYDLKGSKKGRIVKLNDYEKQVSSGLKVLKDLNFIEIGDKLRISEREKQRLISNIERDA